MADVYAVLQKAAEGHPEVLKNPLPQVWMTEFGDSSVNFTVLV